MNIVNANTSHENWNNSKFTDWRYIIYRIWHHIPYLYTHGSCIGCRCIRFLFNRNLLKAKVKRPFLACQLFSLFFATLFVKLKLNIARWYEITSIQMIEILPAWINMNLQIYFMVDGNFKYRISEIASFNAIERSFHYIFGYIKLNLDIPFSFSRAITAVMTANCARS